MQELGRFRDVVGSD